MILHNVITVSQLNVYGQLYFYMDKWLFMWTIVSVCVWCMDNIDMGMHKWLQTYLCFRA